MARELRRGSLDRLGFVRSGDYVAERLGLSLREFQDLARVGRAFERAPVLEAQLLRGDLAWSKVRLLARVVEADRSEGPRSTSSGSSRTVLLGDRTLDEWIGLARRVRCEELAAELKAAKLERARRERNGAGEGGRSAPGRRRAVVQLEISRSTYAWWARTRQLARRQAGRELSSAEVIELATAEALAAFGLDASVELPSDRDADSRLDASLTSIGPVEGGREPQDGRSSSSRRVDPFELDARLRMLVRDQQRADAKLGRVLVDLQARGAHRRAGYARFARYAQARFGLGEHRLKTLLRIERSLVASPVLAKAYRSGRLSTARAELLVPLLSGDLAGVWHVAWVTRAGAVTLRRLRSDVEAALLARELSHGDFRRTGGLPAREDHRLEPEVRAHLCASSPADGLAIPFVFWTDPDRAALFAAALEGLRKRLEVLRGEPVSLDDALCTLLAHACVAWGETRAVPREHRLFERDGWRCQVPGCSGRRNLHLHHVWFASRGGPDEAWNLVTLCASHHLRLLHAGRISIEGRAPERLVFELGLRAAGAPLAVYASGDRLVSAL